MNVKLNKTDSVNATLTVEVAKADYVNEVENSLKDLKRKAIIPGFRKGAVPTQFLRQRYGNSILIEEINKLVSKSLSDYIKDHVTNLLGEPLPSEKQEPIDFDKQEDFVFSFDIGLSPKINVKLTKKDIIPYYLIQVTDEMIDKQIEALKNQHGTREPVEEVEDNDMVKGNLVELNENGEPKENGISIENSTLLTTYILNEEEKEKFIHAKLNSSLIFNPNKAYEGNEAELTSFLNVKKEDVKNYTGDFSFEITEISRFKAADLNQDLFDKVFGKETVDTEEAFRATLKKELAQQFTPESDYKFFLDARKLLEEKTSGSQFPDVFLKRWLLVSDEKRTPESLEEEYPKIIKNLKSRLINELLIEENDITISEDDLLEYARKLARTQLTHFGFNDISDDLLENYAQEMLKKEENYRSLGNKAFEDKLIDILKEQVTLEPQEISVEDLTELLKKEK